MRETENELFLLSVSCQWERQKWSSSCLALLVSEKRQGARERVAPLYMYTPQTRPTDPVSNCKVCTESLAGERGNLWEIPAWLRPSAAIPDIPLTRCTHSPPPPLRLHPPTHTRTHTYISPPPPNHPAPLKLNHAHAHTHTRAQMIQCTHAGTHTDTHNPRRMTRKSTGIAEGSVHVACSRSDSFTAVQSVRLPAV